MIAELKPRKPIHPPFAGTTQNEQITSILSGRKVSLFYSVRLIRLTLITERAFLNGFKFDDAVYGYSNMLSKSNGLNGENLLRNGAKKLSLSLLLIKFYVCIVCLNFFHSLLNSEAPQLPEERRVKKTRKIWYQPESITTVFFS